MKKKQRFLFTLLMAIVMMVVSPTVTWAQDDEPMQQCDHPFPYAKYNGNGQHVEVCNDCWMEVSGGQCYDDDSDGRCNFCHSYMNWECAASGTVIASSGNFGDEVAGNLFDGDLNTKWCSTLTDGNAWVIFKPFGSGQNIIKSYRLVDAIDTWEYEDRRWSRWTIYGTNGNPNNNETEWVAISSEYAGDAEDGVFNMNQETAYSYYKIEVVPDNSSDENVQQMGEMIIEWASVPTFDSIEELLDAGQDFDAVNVTIDGEVFAAMPHPNKPSVYSVILSNGNDYIQLVASTPDPALNWPSGGRVTGTLTNVRWDEDDKILYGDDASFWSALNYAEPDLENIPTYSSIADLLADENLASGTNVTVTVSGTIVMAEYVSDINAYQIMLDNDFAIGAMGCVTSDPGWAVGGTISGTLQNVKFMREEGEEGEEIVAVMSTATNIFAPGAGLEYTAPAGGSESSDVPTYNSIDELLADENLETRTTVTVTVEGTIAEALYMIPERMYQVTLDNGFLIASFNTASDLKWKAGGTISGTLENVIFVKVGDEAGVMSETTNIFEDLEYTAPVAVVASVTIGETTTGYSDIQDALTVAKDAPSATLTLLQDVELPAELEFEKGNITIDLNSHRIITDNEFCAIFVNGGALTITDNSVEKIGIVRNTNGCIRASSGSLTIHAGIFRSTGDGWALYTYNAAKALIDGGRFISESSAVFTSGASALATGYCYYNTLSNEKLEDQTEHSILDVYGQSVMDITVMKDVVIVKGELEVRDNIIDIPAVSGQIDENPSHLNIYKFTAPFDGTMIFKSVGEEDTYGVLFDNQYNYLVSNDDSNDRNFRIIYDVEEGSVYYIGIREYDGNEIANYTIRISQPEHIDEMTIVDGEEYNGEVSTVTSLTYKRTINEIQVEKWQALYVPFQLPVADLNKAGFDVAAINNFHEYTDENGNLLQTDLEIKKLTSGTLNANWPYLIYPKSEGVKTIVLEDVKLATAMEESVSCSSVEREYVFTGIYQPMTGLFSDGYMFLSGGALRTAANDEQELKAQRWYLASWNKYDDDDFGGDDDESEAEAKSINIRVIGEDEANGIEEIRVVSTKVDKNSSAGIYDIQGRKVSAPVKGINIIRQEDGSVRKVMVK